MADILLLCARLSMLLLGVLCAYQGVYTALTLLKKPKTPAKGPQNRYAVLICARNEQAVIGELLDSLKAQQYPQGRLDLYVAADNCTDATAQVARAHGATVYERQDQLHVGKGYALDFLLHSIWKDGGQYAGYFVFDADNLASPDFVARMDEVFAGGYPVVTGYRNSKNYPGWVASGYALSFLRDARFLNAPRMMLRTSCVVTGTGFLVAESVLKQAGGWPWHMLCEDFQFSVEQVLAGRKIGYCADAVFYDEQPTHFAQSVHQRIRWCKGFMQVALRYGARMVGGVCRGCWACADLLLCYMPLILCSAAALGCTLAAAVLSGRMAIFWWGALQMAAFSYLSLAGMGLLTCLTEWKRIQATTRQKLASVATFPLFMATYLLVAVLAVFSKSRWVPIRHTAAMSLKQVHEVGRKKDMQKIA